ncbi:MAG: hypothetical protein FJY66_04850 [Calditrichaeota bacterium]|nr:hypothetical protein [Calditrichota bacterium]
MRLKAYQLLTALCLYVIIPFGNLLAETKLPYLQTFPIISADSLGVYFRNETWTAVWRYGLGRPACVPCSLVRPPEPDKNRAVFYKGDRFFVSGDTLSWAKGIVTGKTYVLPNPTDDALRELYKVGGLKPQATLALGEEMGPIAAGSDRIWFGLVLFDELSQAAVSGLGWFDLETERFVRLYSADIGRLRPRWMAVFGDSVLVLCSFAAQQEENSRLYLYQIHSGEFLETSPRDLGIAGDHFLSALRSGDSVFFSTDYGISLWQPDKPARNFATLSVSARMPVGLSFLTFEPEGEVPFDTLPPGVSTRIWWQAGEWVEVAVPRPVQGFVSSESWAEFGEIWQKRYWDCPQDSCFARIQIPMSGEPQAADFIHTPLTYLDSAPEGVKIGVNAAWVRIQDVVPTFVETQLHR